MVNFERNHTLAGLMSALMNNPNPEQTGPCNAWLHPLTQ
ncbi:MAG: hypothetical protein RL088_3921 [Verrucomicrobiota bacterium]|jgi:hypothetical protein